jgi:transposase
VPCPPRPLTGHATGMALGLESCATRAAGRQIATPRICRVAVAEMKRKRAQRRVSGRKTGRTRRRKAVRLLAKQHLKGPRQRTDFHQTSALVLVQQDATLSHEDVQTANRLKHHPVAKSLTDAAWSGFLVLLSFNAASAGKTVLAVPPAYTAPAGSGCGVIVSNGLWLVRPLASLPGLRNESASGPHRGTEQRAIRAKWARAEPSGAHVARRGERSLRIRADSSPAECQ